MSEIFVNGERWYECLDCGGWTNGLCKCREESKSKAVVKLLNTFRKRYNHFYLVTPFHGKVSG